MSSVIHSIIQSILFIYCKFISDILFQIKLFKWSVINMWAIVHIDTQFLEVEYFNYDNVKPFNIYIYIYIYFYVSLKC
jgi:hypothetical protein